MRMQEWNDTDVEIEKAATADTQTHTRAHSTEHRVFPFHFNAIDFFFHSLYQPLLSLSRFRHFAGRSLSVAHVNEITAGESSKRMWAAIRRLARTAFGECSKWNPVWHDFQTDISDFRSFETVCGDDFCEPTLPEVISKDHKSFMLHVHIYLIQIEGMPQEDTDIRRYFRIPHRATSTWHTCDVCHPVYWQKPFKTNLIGHHAPLAT